MPGPRRLPIRKGWQRKGCYDPIPRPRSWPRRCAARGVAFDAESIYQAIGHGPILAAALARLLIWTDPKPLPAADGEAGAWALYLRTGRPGAYDRPPEELRAKFKRNHAVALKAVPA